MSITKIDWAKETNCAVECTSREMFPTHRGARPWRYQGIAVAFGNDGLADNLRAQDGLADVRSSLATNGIEELGFATNPVGYSWAMLVRSTDHETLDNILWDSKTFRLRVERGELSLTMEAPPIEETLARLTKYMERPGGLHQLGQSLS